MYLCTYLPIITPLTELLPHCRTGWTGHFTSRDSKESSNQLHHFTTNQLYSAALNFSPIIVIMKLPVSKTNQYIINVYSD